MHLYVLYMTHSNCYKYLSGILNIGYLEAYDTFKSFISSYVSSKGLKRKYINTFENTGMSPVYFTDLKEFLSTVDLLY
jgi:hypothetical protein